MSRLGIAVVSILLAVILFWAGIFGPLAPFFNQGGEVFEPTQEAQVQVTVFVPTSTLVPTVVFTSTATETPVPTNTLIPTPTLTPTEVPLSAFTLTAEGEAFMVLAMAEAEVEGKDVSELFAVAEAGPDPFMPYGFFEGVLYEVFYWDFCPEDTLCGSIVFYDPNRMDTDFIRGMNLFSLGPFGDKYMILFYDMSPYLGMDFASYDDLVSTTDTDPILMGSFGGWPEGEDPGYPAGVITYSCEAHEVLVGGRSRVLYGVFHWLTRCNA